MKPFMTTTITTVVHNLKLWRCLFLAAAAALIIAGSASVFYFSKHADDAEEAELPWPIVRYPKSYGAHKYMQRRSSACNQVFPGISATKFLQTLTQRRNRNSNNSSSNISQPRFVSGAPDFGGNVTQANRMKFFPHQLKPQPKIACGFAAQGWFRVAEAERAWLARCRGLAVVSAVFGAYDRIRQPRGVRRGTARRACFVVFVDEATLRQLPFDADGSGGHWLGLWRLILVRDLPYEAAVMNGVVVKYLVHRLLPNCRYSVWMDAKVQLVYDPAVLVQGLLETADVAVSAHAYNVDVMEEAIFTVRWGKWSRRGVARQMNSYCAQGLRPWSSSKLPYPTDVPDTALILRRHGLSADMFSCLMFNEIQVFGARDQLAFAFVRDMMNPKPKFNIFATSIFNAITNEYRHFRPPFKPQRDDDEDDAPNSDDDFVFGFSNSPCRPYFETMWNSTSVYKYQRFVDAFSKLPAVNQLFLKMKWMPSGPWQII